MEYLSSISTISDNIISNLSIEEILNLCSTNLKIGRMCENPLMWIRLIKRDFGIDSKSNDPRSEYFKYLGIDKLSSDLRSDYISKKIELWKVMDMIPHSINEHILFIEPYYFYIIDTESVSYFLDKSPIKVDNYLFHIGIEYMYKIRRDPSLDSKYFLNTYIKSHKNAPIKKYNISDILNMLPGKYVVAVFDRGNITFDRLNKNELIDIIRNNLFIQIKDQYDNNYRLITINSNNKRYILSYNKEIHELILSITFNLLYSRYEDTYYR